MRSKTKQTLTRWGVWWVGNEPGFCFDAGHPVMFQTRAEARKYIHDKYGYIATRKDLRTAPHNWRVPRAERVRLTMELVRA